MSAFHKSSLVLFLPLLFPRFHVGGHLGDDDMTFPWAFHITRANRLEHLLHTWYYLHEALCMLVSSAFDLTTTWEAGATIIPLLLVKLRYKEAEWVSQGPIACRWGNQYSKNEVCLGRSVTQLCYSAEEKNQGESRGQLCGWNGRHLANSTHKEDQESKGKSLIILFYNWPFHVFFCSFVLLVDKWDSLNIQIRDK